MASRIEEDKILTLLERLESEGSESKKGFNDRVKENLGQVRGPAQWKMPGRKPYFLYNVIAENIENKVGKLSEVKPKLFILPQRNGLSGVADVIKTGVDYVWSEDSVTTKLERCAFFGAEMGAATVEVRWNQDLRFGQGEIEVFIRDPRQVIIDSSIKDAADIHKAEYVITEDVEVLEIAQALYGGRGALLIPDPNLSIMKNEDVSTQGQVKTALSHLRKKGSQGRGLAIPRTAIKTYWVTDRRKSRHDKGRFPILDGVTETAPGNRVPFPGGRKIVVGRAESGPIILEDTYNKYWDGMWPIDLLAWNIDLETIWGPDDVQRQIKIQEAINRLGDATVGNTLKNSIIRWMIDRGAMDPTEAKKFAHDGAEVTYKNPGREVTQTIPAPFPPEVLQLIPFLIDLAKRNIGVLDPQIQKQMPSIVTGPAIEGLQLANEGGIRTVARRMEEFVMRFGQKIISRIFQYWTADRPLHFVGDTGEWRDFEFQRSQLLIMPDPKTNKPRPRSIAELQTAFRDFRLKVQPGSSLAITRVQRRQELFDGFKAGGVRLSKVMEEMGIENPEEEMEKAKQEREKFGLDLEEPDGRKKQKSLGSVS